MRAGREQSAGTDDARPLRGRCSVSEGKKKGPKYTTIKSSEFIRSQIIWWWPVTAACKCRALPHLFFWCALKEGIAFISALLYGVIRRRAPFTAHHIQIFIIRPSGGRSCRQPPTIRSGCQMNSAPECNQLGLTAVNLFGPYFHLKFNLFEMLHVTHLAD